MSSGGFTGRDLTPEQTARLIGAAYPPTAEQAAVMAHPMAPQLVVAGAGAGKTETMSLRVVHLVATGQVAPDEVLGLTFTRKAAGELGERLRERLGTLERAIGARRRIPREDLDAARPTVSTYDSFAGTIYKDHALRIGLEPTARLITDAETYELAFRTVSTWTGELAELGESALSTIVAAAVSLDGQMTSLLRADVYERILREELEATAATLLGEGEGWSRSPNADVRKIASRHRGRAELVDIVLALRAERIATGVATFADIASAARRIVTEVPDVADELRARYRLVLLDEYQDTSVAQTDLLAAAFGGGCAVTAVGDPHQSIYGWRGASAAALETFPERFGGATPAEVRSLSTSWRNDVSILEVANSIARPLGAHSSLPLPTLGARPGAGEGSVESAWFVTSDDEAKGIAEILRESWYEPAMRAASGEGAGPAEVGSAHPTAAQAVATSTVATSTAAAPTAAVLGRTNGALVTIHAALLEAGVPAQIVGAGGLVLRPEILDLRAALAAAVDPTRGDLLVRLVTGLGLGLADLRTLHAWSGYLARAGLRSGTAAATAPTAGSVTSAAQPTAAGASGAGAEEPAGGPSSGEQTDTDPFESVIDPRQEQTLAEAIDVLPPEEYEAYGHRLTHVARDRLERLALALRRIRAAAHLPVQDAVAIAIESLGLDLEVVAASPHVEPGIARAGLDEIVRLASSYAAGVDGASLSGFLTYLDRAEEREGGLSDADPSESQEASGAVVQLMTVHRAKGLEWDVVVLPGLMRGTFPAVSYKKVSDEETLPNDNAWLGDLGAVPSSVRGDADRLPQLDLTGVGAPADAGRALKDFGLTAGAHAVLEERRLAYVAVTRARSRLLMTWATFKNGGATPQVRSPFLAEAIRTGEVRPAGGHEIDPPEEPPEENPSRGVEVSAVWPPEPAEEADVSRRARAAAEGVRAAADSGAGLDDGEDAGLWDRSAAILLAERAELASVLGEVPLGEHLAATSLVAMAEDPEGFARQKLRPVPRPPATAATLGTQFHEWVEHRFDAQALTGLVPDPDDAGLLDPALGVAEKDASGAVDERRLAELQEKFEASEWGARRPLAVEAPLQVRVGPVVLRCTIDAVYESADGIDIVDWKTGRIPPEDALPTKLLQLDVNRLAWSRAKGGPVEEVRACLYYVQHGVTIPAIQDDEAATEARILAVLGIEAG
ncbi:ATP-dependent DNA helicase SCO5184 [Actinomycetales bacterium JB111]|nr:ATP-dependent DNA helicase SCO5184 [Actinomycetales bacterium JB111]